MPIRPGPKREPWFMAHIEHGRILPPWDHDSLLHCIPPRASLPAKTRAKRLLNAVDCRIGKGLTSKWVRDTYSPIRPTPDKIDKAMSES